MRTDLFVEPIRQSVTVDRPAEHAFRVFTEQIDRWWPLGRHSVFGDRAATVTVEQRRGGRIVERSVDGEEASWGEILVWEPPRRIVINWHPNPDATVSTEIELRFAAENGSARVELEHRGWERLGDEADEARSSYESGWPGVLARFTDAARG